MAIQLSKKQSKKGTRPGAVNQEELLCYLPVVRKVAYRFAKNLPACVDLNDLVSAGYLGLLHAAERFDPNKGLSFKTFLEFYVKWAILDELRAVDPVPRRSRQKLQNMERIRRKLTGELGRPPTSEEMAKQLGLSVDEYESLISKIAPGFDLSLNLLSQAYRSTLLTDSEKNPPPDRLLLRKELHQRLARAIQELPDRMRTVISLYYYARLNYREISDLLNLTESRICQIRRNAIQHMRAWLEEEEQGTHRPARATA